MSQLGHQPLSPLDGRYRHQTEALSEYFSEAALNRCRVRVEIEWLITLCNEGVAGSTPLPEKTATDLRASVQTFGAEQIAALHAFEQVTKHDVKAVEYFVRDLLSAHGLDDLHELVHFGCTSEDINNVSYALLVRDAVEQVWLPLFLGLQSAIADRARSWRSISMLSRTHGQPATPTTFGKELAVFAHRLSSIIARVSAVSYPAKFSGATGTFSAHVVAEPTMDWQRISKNFVQGLGLTWNPLTTQIESHDGLCELLGAMAHGHRILHNFATDMWTYISLGYVTQIPEPGATGSSTMPHKINPIRFENAEANLELANALLDSLQSSLATSRLQRDLTDSSAQRNIGVAFGHSLVALRNLTKALTEIDVNAHRMIEDLQSNWEVLAEAIQTVIRAEIARGNSSILEPYTVVKELTRGQSINEVDLKTFVESLDISPEQKGVLQALTPELYVGLAAALVDHLKD